jgi:hypothetical protein
MGNIQVTQVKCAKFTLSEISPTMGAGMSRELRVGGGGRSP